MGSYFFIFLCLPRMQQVALFTCKKNKLDYLSLMLKTKNTLRRHKPVTARPVADVKPHFWQGHAHPELTRSGDLFLKNLAEIRQSAQSRGNSV